MSRAEKFRTCPRAYFFHYYGSWGGWERGAPDRVRQLWRLKKLTSRKAWAGSSVHDTIAWALEEASIRGSMPHLETAIGRMQKTMRKEFQESRSGAWKVRRALGLREHAYDEPVDDEEWKDNWEHARRCLESFYESPVSSEILSVSPKQWFPIDSLDSFTLDGVTIYVAPDFAFRDDDKHLRILDWKTGIPKEADRGQVQGYVLFAMDKWSARPEETLAELHYLGAAEVERIDVTPDALDAFKEEIKHSISKMLSRLADPTANLAREEDFEPTPSKHTCNRCNFRGLCDASSATA